MADTCRPHLVQAEPARRRPSTRHGPRRSARGRRARAAGTPPARRPLPLRRRRASDRRGSPGTGGGCATQPQSESLMQYTTKRRCEKLHEPVCNFSGRDVVLAFMNAILVTGATGNVGRPLVTQLAAAGVEVRAVTRQPDTARFPAGVKAVGHRGRRPARRLGGIPQLTRTRRRTRTADTSGTPRRCHAPRCAVGHQRRRRLLAPAVAFPR